MDAGNSAYYTWFFRKLQRKDAANDEAKPFFPKHLEITCRNTIKRKSGGSYLPAAGKNQEKGESLHCYRIGTG